MWWAASEGLIMHHRYANDVQGEVGDRSFPID
jgi:hypothetical protein